MRRQRRYISEHSLAERKCRRDTSELSKTTSLRKHSSHLRKLFFFVGCCRFSSFKSKGTSKGTISLSYSFSYNSPPHGVRGPEYQVKYPNIKAHVYAYVVIN